MQGGSPYKRYAVVPRVSHRQNRGRKTSLFNKSLRNGGGIMITYNDFLQKMLVIIAIVHLAIDMIKLYNDTKKK